MRMRAADEMGVSHAQKLYVVDVTALAGDETAVFLAHNAGANTFNAHRISPCRAACSAQIETKAPSNGRFLEILSFTPVRAAMSESFRCLREVHAAGGVEHRFDDIVIAGAAADVAFQLVPYGLLVKLAAVAVH